jgi:hypothetical protein
MSGPDFISQVLDDCCTCKCTRKDLAMERNIDGSVTSLDASEILKLAVE